MRTGNGTGGTGSGTGGIGNGTCEPANLRTGSGTCELAVELALEPANWALACLVELALELQGHPPLPYGPNSEHFHQPYELLPHFLARDGHWGT